MPDILGGNLDQYAGSNKGSNVKEFLKRQAEVINDLSVSYSCDDAAVISGLSHAVFFLSLTYVLNSLTTTARDLARRNAGAEKVGFTCE